MDPNGVEERPRPERGARLGSFEGAGQLSWTREGSEFVHSTNYFEPRTHVKEVPQNRRLYRILYPAA